MLRYVDVDIASSGSKSEMNMAAILEVDERRSVNKNTAILDLESQTSRSSIHNLD